MASCYLIPYRDRFGLHSAIKWGESPSEATATLKKAHTIPGRGAATYDDAALVQPQPFSDESREIRAAHI